MAESNSNSSVLTTMNTFNDQQQRAHWNVAAEQPCDDRAHSEPRLAVQGMRLQPVTLDKAVSPLLPKPTAPFARSERKRAHTNAVYYSECFLRGIEPLLADTAAAQAQKAFDKWWIKSTANNISNQEKHAHHKRCRGDDGDKDEREQKHARHNQSQSDQMSISSDPNVVSVASSQVDFPKRSHYLGQTATLPPVISTVSTSMCSKSRIEAVKMNLINELRTSGGNVDTPAAQQCLEILQTYYARGGIPKVDPSSLAGNWMTISKPTYSELKGKTEKGESRYTLGRISFDMFKPTGLECSVQASFNHVRQIDPKNPGRSLHVPRKLMKDVNSGSCRLYSYDIVVAITVEAGQDRKGNRVDSNGITDEYIVPRDIHAILTTQGYFIADPSQHSRLSIWFSGGTLEVQDEVDDLDEWKRIFDMNSVPDRSPEEYANILAAKVLLGAHVPEKMDEDGTMRFSLKRPIGGHNSVFVDVVYMDEKLRIMKGHHGSVYVCIRVPEIK